MAHCSGEHYRSPTAPSGEPAPDNGMYGLAVDRHGNMWGA